MFSCWFHSLFSLTCLVFGHPSTIFVTASFCQVGFFLKGVLRELSESASAFFVGCHGIIKEGPFLFFVKVLGSNFKAGFRKEPPCYHAYISIILAAAGATFPRTLRKYQQKLRFLILQYLTNFSNSWLCLYHMMAIFSCFSTLLVGKKKKSKKSPKPADNSKKGSIDSGLRVNPIELVIPSTGNGLKEPNFPVSKSFPSKEKRSSILPKVLSNDSLARTESVGEAAYEGSDEHDDIQSVKRDFSELNLQLKGELASHGSNTDLNTYVLENKLETDEGLPIEAMFASGHASDPGMERTAFWGSPVLERSCSNIETKRTNRLVKSPKRSSSYSNLQNLTGNGRLEFTYEAHSSPLSVRTSCSADRVMLKRRSSSQVLPSRSRKIWWKLFLWSHRNLHKRRAPQRLASVLSSRNHKDGYVSDTHEPGHKPDNKKKPFETENQWVAFSLGSSHMDRVNAWVNSLEDSTSCPIDVEENCDEKEDERTAGLHHLEFGESSGKNLSHSSRHAAEEVIHANNIIQSLNSFSSVAHISGIGLKVIPSIWAFNSLRSVNLSANYIVHIAPGSLPKSLHTLDLSRNKISTIEGLRDLAKLRVLILSYNRISRVGHGLSNCTIIKELYLAGNKISDVEGLHRLLKLTVLDLAFNKISTAKALGQLVANYNSLLALNLIGNPIQNNIGDEHLRKAVLSLMPHLAYLNKQPVKPLRVREAAKDSVARAALGDALWSSRRRTTKRSIQVSGSSTKSRIGEGSSRGTRHRPKSRHQQSSSGRK